MHILGSECYVGVHCYQTCHTWSPGTLSIKDSEMEAVLGALLACEKGRDHVDAGG